MVMEVKPAEAVVQVEEVDVALVAMMAAMAVVVAAAPSIERLLLHCPAQSSFPAQSQPQWQRSVDYL